MGKLAVSLKEQYDIEPYFRFLDIFPRLFKPYTTKDLDVPSNDEA